MKSSTWALSPHIIQHKYQMPAPEELSTENQQLLLRKIEKKVQWYLREKGSLKKRADIVLTISGITN